MSLKRLPAPDPSAGCIATNSASTCFGVFASDQSLLPALQTPPDFYAGPHNQCPAAPVQRRVHHLVVQQLLLERLRANRENLPCERVSTSFFSHVSYSCNAAITAAFVFANSAFRLAFWASLKAAGTSFLKKADQVRQLLQRNLGINLRRILQVHPRRLQTPPASASPAQSRTAAGHPADANFRSIKV